MRTAFAALGSVVLLSLSSGSSHASPDGQTRPAGPSYVRDGQISGVGAQNPAGSWIVEVSPTIQPHFVSLVTITSDGGIVETNSLALGSPPESPGHGNWIRTGPRSFATTFVNLLVDDQGGFAGTARVRSRVRLNKAGNVFTGPFQVDILDPDGNLLFSDSGTARGTRIEVEPMP